MAQKWLQRILLVNDDGIDAPGIKLLEGVAEQLADEVWVIAPATDKSGVANSVSLREPVRVDQRGERRFAVHGTPADCVTVAVRQLMKEQPPQLLLSGINNGSNIGFETVLSGTVGAAITGLLFGVPSVALSQDKRPEDLVNWRTAEAFCLPVLDTLISRGLLADRCLSINFPDLPAEKIRGIKATRQGIGKVKGLQVVPTTDPHGENYFWIRVEHGVTAFPEHSEARAVSEGYISVTPLMFERTAMESWHQLSDILNSPH
ncbi:5'/3'-nucleotidase SurE [Enterobacter sp. 10-1]|uniref:5'/3'-nucleotidase SurE n=1 Tax=Raoultella sp. 10-1 TaxID=2683201 RepID=UPI000BA3DC80|nr:5'/3'-nucleotidase SurE [Enterobacter sp. 10-1]MVT04153.1 5'/3'-nucleotidase SurE [Raoultella sp. 10-1]PAC10262.1 5'/3'-nucleotidase SurE [Enterobacter sp. 10-1]